MATIKVWDDTNKKWLSTESSHSFGTVKVGDVYIDADGPSDTLELLGDDNIKLLPNESFDKVVITVPTVGDLKTLLTDGKDNLVSAINELTNKVNNGPLAGGPVSIKREEFIATANQQVFTLTTGFYTVGQNQLSIYLNGSKQPNSAYTETSDKSFKMAAGLSAGIRVLAEFISINDPITTPNSVANYQDTPPSSPVLGQLWYAPTSKELTIWNGTSWTAVNTYI